MFLFLLQNVLISNSLPFPGKKKIIRGQIQCVQARLEVSKNFQANRLAYSILYQNMVSWCFVVFNNRVGISFPERTAAHPF